MNNLSQTKLTIPGNVTCTRLELEKLLTAEERKRLLADEAEFQRLLAIMTENAPSVVNERLSRLRGELMNAGGPLSHAELDSFTKSASETKELAAERHRIVYVRTAKHCYENVRPLCVAIYRKLLPKVEAMIAEAETAEKKMHTQWGLSLDVLPVTNTVRQFVERLHSYAKDNEDRTADGGHYGPRDTLGLLIDWSKIEPAAKPK